MSKIVPQFKDELFVYEYCEQRVVDALERFRHSLRNDMVLPRKKELYTILMALMR
jgi:hypothetical protein